MATPQPRHRLILGSLMIAMFLAAMEATIVATAMPSIVGSLGGFANFGWVFSIFLLTQAATIPLYGKMSDTFGRKPVFLFGTGLFLIGSLLAGTAQSMPQLIAFRGVQGLGAGAIQPVATTIVGDMYTLEQRAKIQGYLSSVWAVASVVGPAIGGVIVDNFSWQWIFFVNVPVGLVAMLGVGLFLEERVEAKRHEIDYVGSITLMLGTSALMLALLEGGIGWAWTSFQSVALFLAAAAILSLFIWNEAHRAKEPILTLELFRNPIIFPANAATLLAGGLIIGMSSYIPTFAQGVLGTSASKAGSLLAAMSIGWPLASTFAGRIYLRLGYRTTALIGAALTVAAGGLLWRLGPHSDPFAILPATFTMGLGMGLSMTTFIVSVQSSVQWSERGAATSSNMFARQLGGTVGVALLSAVLNGYTSEALPQAARGVEAVNRLLDPAERALLAPTTIEQLRDALAGGLHWVFTAMWIVAAINVVIVSRLPRGLPPRERQAE